MIIMPMKERKPISSDKAVSPSDKENNKLKCITTQGKPEFKLCSLIFPFESKQMMNILY